MFSYCPVEMLWWQAVSLITIVYSSKSSGKFLGSSYLCDTDFEGHTREISPSIIFDMIWLMYLRLSSSRNKFCSSFLDRIVDVWIAKIQHFLEDEKYGQLIKIQCTVGMIVRSVDVQSHWQRLTTHNCMHRMAYGRWKERTITIWDLKRNIQSVPRCYMRWLLRKCSITIFNLISRDLLLLIMQIINGMNNSCSASYTYHSGVFLLRRNSQFPCQRFV